MTIIDDNTAEFYFERIEFELGIYESDRMVTCDYHSILIEDNDGNVLHYTILTNMQHTAIVLSYIL